MLALKREVEVEDLVNCLVDGEKFQYLVGKRTRFGGVEGKLRAIMVIQRFWRMHTIRRQYRHFRMCVVKLQGFMKKFINRLRTRRQIH